MSVAVERSRAPRDWRRRYPPLIVAAVALIAVILLLPSALNVPQTNPTQTEEYAPVPPDNHNPPHKGNVSALGTGNNATITNALTPLTVPLPPPVAKLPLQGKTPTTKQCVRDAYGTLRQTDDPLSPPCVADFRGDNFGATYQGVTGNEIRILVYLQGDFTYVRPCSTANEQTGSGVYYDLAQPPTGQETCVVTGLRIFQRYFNDRYQTYGRFVHFYAFYSAEADSPEGRRADAADNYQRIKPFAVISYGQTFESDYLEAMAQYHVLNFGSFTGRDNAFFQAYPKLIWGYAPSVEQQAANYATFLCTKVAGKPVSFADATTNGRPRKYGLLFTTDPGHAELREFKDLVVAQLSACGINFAAQATFPETDYFEDPNESTSDYAQINMVRFKQDGITTIIWAGGIEDYQSQSAAALGYFHEQIVAGEGSFSDGYGTEDHQNQQVWSHAWVVTFEPYVPALRQTVCYQAYKSVAPEATDVDARTNCVGDLSVYDQLRQLFTGIQVAGPRLGPTSVDQGFHAIPAIPSRDPRVPACFYDPGDYTCIKDGVAEWWDPNGTPDGATQPGCWRASDGGQRYLTGQWPAGDVLTLEHANDPCSTFGAGSEFRA